jgi:signal transduction histidine kinase
MSHEIRTPMNGILGFADLLKKPLLSVEKQKMYVDIIKKSGLRMLNLINDIMDISKIESGIIEINNKSISINKQLNFIYTFFKAEAEEKELKLEYLNSSSHQDDELFTDEEKFMAILTNLVKNAIKYTNQGVIQFGYTKKDSNLEFYVKDTGIGISKDRHNAIFERFIQADIKDQSASEGTGLGLSISKAYVKMLGGEIWVESDKEELPASKAGGSTFYFTIPFNSTSK